MQRNLLLVDDEVGILQAIRRMLRSGQYRIFEAANTAEALDIIDQQDIHLLVTDFKMPGEDGLALCRQVRRLSPATYRILLSGQVDYPALQQAWRNGDVHRFVAKPWDNLLLTSDIQEGLKQHQLLRKAHYLRHNIQSEQPLLLTDANWVIRLANPPMCQALGVEESDLVGVNLFAQTLSSMPFELEAEVTTQVEASNSWLGFFSFFRNDQSKAPAWMTITSVSEHYRVGLCRFCGEEISPPTDFRDELKRYAGSHHLQRLEQDASEAGDNPELIVVTFDDQVNNKDLSSICYERLQAATDEQFEIYSPQLNVFLVLVPGHSGPAGQQLQQIKEDFSNSVRFQGERLLLTPDLQIESKPQQQAEWREWLRQKLGLPPAQEQAAIADDSSSHQADKEDNQQATYRVRPLFSQRGEVVALLAPTSLQDEQSWQHWLLALQQAWQADFSGDFPLICDAQEWTDETNQAFLRALYRIREQHPVHVILIASETQILGDNAADLQLRSAWHEAGCQLVMANFGRSFLNSRQILSLPIQGVMLAPEFLSNMRNSKSLPQSRRLLQRIHDHDLMIYAPDINTTEELAAAHQSNVDWLSGDVLSKALTADQLTWFAL